MAATLIQETDPIPVKQIGCVLYGQPGARKTSIAQTAHKPFTFACDKGIYRAFGRKACAMFDQWEDVVALCREADTVRKEGTGGSGAAHLLAEAKTVVIDTITAAMRKLAQAIMQESAKNGTRLGGLSLQGYGVLANRFSSFVHGLFERGQDLVLLAQEDSDGAAEGAYYFPSVVGKKFYNEAMEIADLVGYMHFHDGKRVVGWAPTDRYMAKAPPCGWSMMGLPDFADRPSFLGDLLDQAKESMGRVSAASSTTAQEVAQWQARLDADPPLEQFNAMLPEIGKSPVKAQLWHLTKAFAERAGLVFDPQAKRFTKGAA